MSANTVQVALPVPLRKTFDYLIDDGEAVTGDWVGCRVQVPFRGRQHVGIVTDINAKLTVSKDKLKKLNHRLDQSAVLPPDLLSLAHWLADFYLHPIGDVLSTMLPSTLRKGHAASMAPVEILEKQFVDIADIISQVKNAKRQLALCEKLNESSMDLKRAKSRFSSQVVKALIDKGLAKISLQSQEAAHWQNRLLQQSNLKANLEQSIAVSAINQAKGFASYLLEGVTGSGKTEVYLQVIEQVLASGKQVLVLVPEIGLTPQTLHRFENRFGQIVGLVHSGLNDSERLRAWQQVKQDQLGILIGTRSSVFAPMANLGMIIVDEEHDESFKQQDKLKYHARDIAVYRAMQLGIPLVMGSATPSLETLHNAFSKKYHHLRLTQRAANASMPSQHLLNITGQHLEHGIASGLIEKMRVQLTKGNQVLVFVNRRGYAPALICHDCGHVENCEQCEMPFTVHKTAQNMQCHRCAVAKPMLTQCSQCQSRNLETYGLGTEQIEQGLQALFPDYSCVRIDSDSMRGKHALNKMLDEVNSAKHHILIGTQILSKGHHFPKVSLAIIVNVDSALFSADFRGPEKLGQLITQLSGRAGRANAQGEVWLQTHQPQHPLLQDLIQNGFADFARSLLLEREHAHLPPYTHQILIRCESEQAYLIEGFLHYAKSIVGQFSKLRIIGPLPCAIEKKQGRFRWMLIMQSASRQYLHQAMTKAINAIAEHKHASRVRWSIDVAPIDFS